jgi:hypothetical protein
VILCPRIVLLTSELPEHICVHQNIKEFYVRHSREEQIGTKKVCGDGESEKCNISLGTF